MNSPKLKGSPIKLFDKNQMNEIKQAVPGNQEAAYVIKLFVVE